MPREEGRLTLVEAADGEGFLEARLAWMVGRREAGRREAGPAPIAVFDLDNTVFDTRPRTLAVARAFDALHPARPLARLTLGDVRRDGRATASQADLGPLSRDVVEAFAAFWDDHFWRPERLAHDAPIAAVVAWARAARAVGAELRFLTGRIASLRAATHEALARAGLGVAPAALACKPDLATRTAPWKCEVLTAWLREAPLGWYVTEGRRDTACIQAEVPEVPCALLDCSFEDEGRPVARGTPLLPRVF